MRSGCQEMLQFLAGTATDVVCFASPDLTTNNTASPPGGPTTPADNSLPGLPRGAFTPQTDRAVISPDPPDHTRIDKAVPGIQVQGRFADDPTGEARFLLRLPNEWNGNLVVAGAAGTRSEFNGDFAWSDYVLQKGYAYASQNKGTLNLYVSADADSLACRLNPTSKVFVHFYASDPAKPITQWAQFMIRTAQLAQGAVESHYHDRSRRTYAVGTSNGGYQVRRALEEAPALFDGGVDWEGTFIDPGGPNLLIDLPPAIGNFPAYAASGFDPDSLAARKILAAGYPPDMVVSAPLGRVSPWVVSAQSGKVSFWGVYWENFWEVSMAQWQKRLDPTFDTYGAGLSQYDYAERCKVPDVECELAAIATTGKIGKPLVSVAGTRDALLPIECHARVYRARVRAWQEASDGRGKPEYRLYEVQNGNHIDMYRSIFPQLELMQPHAHRAFDLLVEHVENGAPLPPDQCIPCGGTISIAPEI